MKADLRTNLTHGLYAVVGFWITSFFMEWVVFDGIGFPDGYVLRVWAFVDLLGSGLWWRIQWLSDYEWLAMVIDYLLEGSVAFLVVFTISFITNKKKLKDILVVISAIMLAFVGIASAGSIHFSYEGNATNELYIGGYIHFPKSIADRIKVTGGVLEQENENGWLIKATNPVVNVEYIKVTDEDFSYSKKTFKAKEYPSELYEPVEPNEMRLTLKELKIALSNMTAELNAVKTQVKSIADKPTAGEQLMGFLLYFPPMWVVYAVFGVLGILAVLGWWYERD